MGGTEPVLRSPLTPLMVSEFPSWAPIGLSCGAQEAGRRRDEGDCPLLGTTLLPKTPLWGPLTFPGPPQERIPRGLSWPAFPQPGGQPAHGTGWWKGPPGFLDGRHGQWVR